MMLAVFKLRQSNDLQVIECKQKVEYIRLQGRPAIIFGDVITLHINNFSDRTSNFLNYEK